MGVGATPRGGPGQARGPAPTGFISSICGPILLHRLSHFLGRTPNKSVLPQSSGQLFRAAADSSVQLRPELFAVVFEPGMNEFVQYHVIPQLIGQSHQVYVQIDAIL